MGSFPSQDCVLKIDSRGEELASARNYIAGIAEGLGFDKSAVYDIKVAVGEALANAIEHGSPQAQTNKVKISCRHTTDEMTIKISDEGVFKREIPSGGPNSGYRGHGIHLMLALMDAVMIDESPHGTTVSLVKRNT